MISWVRTGPILAGIMAVFVSGCAGSRLAGLEGPRYSGGPDRPAVHTPPRPAKATAPVYTVERSVAAPDRVSSPMGRGTSRSRGWQDARSQTGNGQAFGSTPERSGYGEAYRGQPAGRREPYYERQGIARWMGQSWIGHKTTTREPFDPDRLTGAHATLPLPSYLYVTNKANGRTVLIRLNDRPAGGPARRDGTAVMVSRRVADLLQFSRTGTAEVELQYAGPAGLVSSGQHEESFLRRQPWYGERGGRMAGAHPMGRHGPSYRGPREDFAPSSRSGLTR